MATATQSPIDPDPGPAAPPSVRGWDEETVAARAQDGDLEAFAELVDRYSAPLFRLAVRMVHDRALAEDIVQDVFLTCWRKLPSLEQPATFRAWIYQISSRRCLDALRRQQVRPEATTSYDLEETRLTDPSGNPEREVMQAAQIAALNTELASLPPQLRLCWVMREIHGLSYDEIAIAVRAPVSTVRGRIARARMVLAERMEPWR